MLSQWECFLQNIGEWQGSFTQISPEGKQIKDTPTVCIFEEPDNNQTVRQLLRRFPPNQPPQDRYYEYREFGDNILFFEDGSFSMGATVCNQFSRAWAELCLKEGDRRLRLVQVFNYQNRLDYLTLIREKFAGTDTPERQPLTLEQLLGTWKGEAIQLTPDLSDPKTVSTHLSLNLQGEKKLYQELTFGTELSSQTISSTAEVGDNQLIFSESEVPKKILFLPDGASANFPVEVQLGKPFFLEVGWLVKPNQRRRLIRNYNGQGEWASLVIINEHKTS